VKLKRRREERVDVADTDKRERKREANKRTRVSNAVLRAAFAKVLKSSRSAAVFALKFASRLYLFIYQARCPFYCSCRLTVTCRGQ